MKLKLFLRILITNIYLEESNLVIKFYVGVWIIKEIRGLINWFLS